MMDEKCHFIGIGGIGMSGLARILISKKVQVSGSDLSSTYVTDSLAQAGAKVYIGHSHQYITPGMTVVYSTDVKEENPEYQAALSMKCTLLHRSDLLVKLMEPYKTLAVAGTHGKTTTTALLASVLLHGGLDPAFAVGGMLPQLKANGGHGVGDYFVAEADESDGTFLKYSPYGGIVTNIDFDHMDYFETEENLIAAFETFLKKTKSPEHLFWCGDDKRLSKLNMPGINYGFEDHCKLRASRFQQIGWKIRFDVDYKGQHYPQVEVALTGYHNALNALAVFGLALSIGIPEAEIRTAFSAFKGVMRRCEKKGEIQGILMLDDYAHHPTEIKTTLHAIKLAVQEKRLIAVYQPHRYTRTKSCLGTFGKIFDDADEVIITDIFGARETPIPGVSHEQILNEVRAHSNVRCRYVPRQQLAVVLADELLPHDTMVSLGAGDITKLAGELLALYKHKAPRKLKVGVVFGGRSAEHEISLRSAHYISNGLNKQLYDKIHFGITRQGEWLCHEDVLSDLEQRFKSRCCPPKDSKTGLSAHVMEKLLACDVIFPVLHGTFGEDGTIQGFFEILGKAYAGPDWRCGAISMDKALTKKLMQLNNLSTAPFVDFSIESWKQSRQEILKKINASLRYPLFAKPVHLGSTVGVSKVERPEELEAAIEKALSVDVHALVENGINAREIEFAVLGNNRVIVLPPGEVVTNGKLHDFESKYGECCAESHAKANLSEALIQEGMNFAELAYRAAGCSGMARVDFFLDEKGKYWLNEINPIPGFTKSSLFPMMCEANGYTPAELVDQLIIFGMQRKRTIDRTHA